MFILSSVYTSSVHVLKQETPISLYLTFSLVKIEFE